MTARHVTRAGLLWAFAMAVCGLAFSVSIGAQGQGPQDPDPERFIVKFVNEGPGRAALAAAGGEVLLNLPEVGAAAARIPARAVEALANHPAIEYIEPDHPRYPFAQTSPYGVAMVQANLVSDAQAANRMICIIDSGYDASHEDLPPASGTSVNFTFNWFEDHCGHGTLVAGTIAALNNDRGVLGVLPNGTIGLHIIKVFGDNCTWQFASNLISAANLCRDAGANIINMSLGGPSSSITEGNAFQDLYNQGILSVAAAGNGGSTEHHYPASYDSVVSVAAIDSAMAHADFSQRNNQVELAAPGVAVRSTLPMNRGLEESATVGGTSFEVIGMEGSPSASNTGPLVDCGLGMSACPGGGGQVCLIQRGEITFADKVLNCEAGGGVGAIIYNNVEALFYGTLGETSTGIPSVGTSDTTGAELLDLLGQSATVTMGPGHYFFFDGTSMATPHVSGVAGLVWSHNTAWTNQQIRDALAITALDLGEAGRDDSFGWGLVQAEAALDYLTAEDPPANQPPTIEPIADRTVTVGDLVEVTPVVTDPENDPFTLSWDGVPPGAEVNGAFVWEPTPDDVGDHVVTVTATQDDNPELFDSEQFVISVLPPPNQPPTIEPIADRTVTVGDLVEVTPVVTDPENDPFVLTWSGVPAGAVVNGTFSWTPAADQVGDHLITVTATQADDPALSDEQTFTISVDPAPPPEIEADVAVSIAASPNPVPAQTASALTYVATVTNHGPAVATGVALTVRLPGGVNFESVDPDSNICSAQGRNVTCAIGALASGETFVATIVIGTKGGNSLTAEATVSANEADPEIGNNSDSVTVSVCRKDCT